MSVGNKRLITDEHNQYIENWSHSKYQIIKHFANLHYLKSCSTDKAPACF